MLKKLLLQKGWAGRTISRAETVDRLNPVLKALIVLNHHYDAFIRSSLDPRLGAELDSRQKTARMDAGKLAESIFSCGGTAYNGTDLEPSDFAVPGSRDEAIRHLTQKEKAFIDLIAGESEVEHQMRTRAILSVVRVNAEERLETLGRSGR